MKVWILELFEGDVEDTYGTGTWFVERVFTTKEAAEACRWEEFPQYEERNIMIEEWDVHV